MVKELSGRWSYRPQIGLADGNSCIYARASVQQMAPALLTIIRFSKIFHYPTRHQYLTFLNQRYSTTSWRTKCSGRQHESYYGRRGAQGNPQAEEWKSSRHRPYPTRTFEVFICRCTYFNKTLQCNVGNEDCTSRLAEWRRYSCP